MTPIIPDPGGEAPRGLSSFRFHGHDAAVFTDERGHWVFLNQLCGFMSIDAENQRKRVNRNHWSQGWTATMAVQVPGDTQARNHFLIHQRRLPMWLGSITTSAIKDKDARQRVEEHQTEFADALADYLLHGGAINPRANLRQLDSLRDQVESQRVARLREMSDYRAVTKAIAGAGGDREDFRDVQDFIYLELFGMSAETIRKRQPQVNGKRRKRDDRWGRAGELIASGVAKDHLTERQLKRLDAMVLSMSSMLGAWYPDGEAPLHAIHEAVQLAAKAVTHQPRVLGGAA